MSVRFRSLVYTKIGDGPLKNIDIALNPYILRYMHRAIFYTGSGSFRADVASPARAREDAQRLNLLGVAVTMRPKSEGPSGYSYFIVKGGVRGVGKREFEIACV